MKQSQQLISESMQNLRTVRSLVAEQATLEQYAVYLNKPLVASLKYERLGALAYGFSQGVIFLIYALGYWYGSTLVHEEGLGFEKVLQAMMCMMMGAAGMGQALAFMPDVAEAKAAAHDVFEILDSKILLDVRNTKKMVPVQGPVDTIEFKEVVFSYPQRPEVKALNGLSFTVARGQKVALVGPSGGGKSTVIQLLERFYDPKGSILVNGQDLRALDPKAWRGMIGLVAQEPVLMNLSLYDNVKYGKLKATKSEVEDVAVRAGMMDFVRGGEPSGSLSSGVHWDETLGPKG